MNGHLFEMPVSHSGHGIFYVSLLTICVAVFASTFAFIWLLKRFAPALSLIDVPNHRSLHGRPVPKIGGVAVVCVSGVAGALAIPNGYGALLIVTLALMAVSIWDDVRNLPVVARLSAHVAAAVTIVLLYPSGSWPFALLTVLTIVWMVNLYNFMDGADGLAGGMTAIGFAAMALVLLDQDMNGLGLFALAISVAALAFLCFNFPPASVFMGDAGSVPLGFLAAGIGYLGYLGGAWAYWYPALLFSPFIFDATYTLVRRARKGHPVWSAHREHLYQRLILAGWSHRRLVLVAYGIILAVNVTALIALQVRGMAQIAVIVSALLMLVGLFAWAERYLASLDEQARP